jgi:hypothetical protein
MTKNKMKKHRTERDRLTEQALELLRSPDLLKRYFDVLRRSGLVGEERNAAVLLIAGISRLLDRPLNLIVKGHSSAGKNQITAKVEQPAGGHRSLDSPCTRWSGWCVLPAVCS